VPSRVDSGFEHYFEPGLPVEMVPQVVVPVTMKTHYMIGPIPNPHLILMQPAIDGLVKRRGSLRSLFSVYNHCQNNEVLDVQSNIES
jgi:hypothetical protein